MCSMILIHSFKVMYFQISTFNRGNRFLENALQETHSLRYFKYNLFNFTTVLEI
jgi:hypothetical protein